MLFANIDIAAGGFEFQARAAAVDGAFQGAFVQLAGHFHR